jgi:hypothetical protein
MGSHAGRGKLAIPRHQILLKPKAFTSRNKMRTLSDVNVVGDATSDVSGKYSFIKSTLAQCGWSALRGLSSIHVGGSLP